MGPAIQLAELNRLTRTAVKLIKGIQIIDSEATFEMAVFSVIGWFKATPSIVLLPKCIHS